MITYKIIVKDPILHTLKEFITLAKNPEQAEMEAKKRYPSYFIKAVYKKEHDDFYEV